MTRSIIKESMLYIPRFGLFCDLATVALLKINFNGVMMNVSVHVGVIFHVLSEKMNNSHFNWLNNLKFHN